LCATTHGDSGVVAFIADDEASAQTVPGSAGTGYLIRPVLTVRMQNQPGIGAATFRKLADVGINVDLLLPVRICDELFLAVICVDDVAAAHGSAPPGQCVKGVAGYVRSSGEPGRWPQ